MFDTIAPRYDLVNRVMTLGLDRSWRRHAVACLTLPAGSRVLDVACGTGDLCRVLAGAGYQPVGIDMSAGMLHHARTPAPLVLGDALTMPFAPACLDGAVSGFALRNFVALPPLFTELAGAIRSGGRISLLDVSRPTSPLLRAGHRLWLDQAVPRIGAALSDPAAYRYLPRSVSYLPPAAQLIGLLEVAGFGAVERVALSGGITQLFTATRSASPPGAGDPR